MAMKPIALSFKNTPEEIELYKWIVGHSNYSGFIKDILKAAKEGESKAGFPKENKPKLIDLDF